MGLSPFKNTRNNLNLKLSVPQSCGIVLAVLLYWLGVGMTFLIDRSNSYKLSVISNWIQIIANAIALTVAGTNSLVRELTVNSIIKSFEKIDAELSYLKIELNYGSYTKKYRIVLLFCSILLLSTTIFDFVVSLYLFKKFRFWYWFVTILPLIVYTLALSQAFFIIGFIKQRFQLINQVFCESLTNDKTSVGNVKNVVLISILNEKTPKISVSELFSKLYISLNELCELTQYVDLLFGPLLLSTFVATFAVIAIQSFHCYMTIITNSKDHDDLILPLIQSIDIIVINLLLVIGITSACESVTREVEKTIQYSSKQQIRAENLVNSLQLKFNLTN